MPKEVWISIRQSQANDDPRLSPPEGDQNNIDNVQPEE